MNDNATSGTGKGAKKGGKAGAAAKLVLCSAALLAFLGVWEGNAEYTVYADKLAGGLPTVCKGLTKHITRTPIVVGEEWSSAKCEKEERAAVTRVQTRLLRCFDPFPPPQSVFDMATSHAWNLGVGATCGSAAMKAWNRQEWQLGCRRLAFSDDGRRAWSYVKTGKKLSNGKPEHKFVQGLANRRSAEYAACVSSPNT